MNNHILPQPDKFSTKQGAFSIFKDYIINKPQAPTKYKNLGNGVSVLFTGLTDCDDTEIYEGDILNKDSGKTNKTAGVFTVIWKGAGFSILNDKSKYQGWLGKDVANHSKVIGNIFTE